LVLGAILFTGWGNKICPCDVCKCLHFKWHQPWFKTFFTPNVPLVPNRALLLTGFSKVCVQLITPWPDSIPAIVYSIRTPPQATMNSHVDVFWFRWSEPKTFSGSVSTFLVCHPFSHCNPPFFFEICQGPCSTLFSPTPPQRSSHSKQHSETDLQKRGSPFLGFKQIKFSKFSSGGKRNTLYHPGDDGATFLQSSAHPFPVFKAIRLWFPGGPFFSNPGPKNPLNGTPMVFQQLPF